MNIMLRLFLIIGAVVLLLFMLKRIRQSKLKIEYTIFWIIFASLLVFMGIFPKFFYVLSAFMGFQAPMSMVLLAIIFVLIVKTFFMTIQISQLENKIDALTQQIAINRKIDADFQKERWQDEVE